MVWVLNDDNVSLSQLYTSCYILDKLSFKCEINLSFIYNEELGFLKNI